MPELDTPIARGRTADVHLWDETHILKLFHNWFELENIEYEQKLARAVRASGVKSPAVGEIIHVEGRNGLIYERVKGESMFELIMRKPWNVYRYARMLAILQTQMHTCSFDEGMPHQRKRIQTKIHHADALPESVKKSLLDSLALLVDGDRVCHGDFHPANVLIDRDDATVIDWIDATRGNPIADVARTTIILIGAAEGAHTNFFMRLLARTFHSVYLKHYFRLQPGGEKEYQQWLPIIAGARLSENIPELEKWLISQATPANIMQRDFKHE